jgi:dihydrofolate synthase/folylpolyglutamate synthase
MQDVRRGLAEVTLPGRFQVLPGRPQVILDVAHNAEAAQTLADNLAASGYARETIAVFGMLRDKDIAAVARALAPRITRWHVASLPGPRGASAAEVVRALAVAGVAQPAMPHDAPASAFAAARGEAHADDRIVAFGSFLTVAEVMQALAARRGREPHG